MNDNRSYHFGIDSKSNREEYPVITAWIPKGSRVVDLGAGDGSLLAVLQHKGINGEGVEISRSGVLAARRKGLKARQGRIDMRLPYKNNSFDIAICNVTLQMVMFPEVLLREMKRVARQQIVSFPNFAFFPNRLDLLINGRMPRYMIPGYRWYSTGHIHQLSIKDFEDFCRAEGFAVVKRHFITPKRALFVPAFLLRLFPNAWSTVAIYLLEAKK